MTKFSNEYNMEQKPVNTMCISAKFSVPDELTAMLDPLLVRTREVSLPKMLTHRELCSSKYYDEIPCVLAKSLIRKYQRRKCKVVNNLVLPVNGDKGRQIKIEEEGLRIPAFFGKKILPFKFPKAVVGHVLNIEFWKRNSKWQASVQYNTPKEIEAEVDGCVGIDRNSVGHVATLGDPQTGKVLHLGFNPAGTKKNFRQRRANLQSLGRKGRRIRRKFRIKQSRRTKHENHLVSKQIVSYAKAHRCAIAVENLGSIGKGKAKSYVQKSQWAFSQLLQYILYKAALLGVPVINVNPAYSSQECSRCGQRNKPNGKSYICAQCKHKDHRDANASFVIAQRGNLEALSMGIIKDSARLGGAVLVTPILEVV